MTTADDGEGLGGVHEPATGHHVHRLTACVHHLQHFDLADFLITADTEDAVLGVEHDVLCWIREVSDEVGYADTQVDEPALLQLGGDSHGDELARQTFFSFGHCLCSSGRG